MSLERLAEILFENATKQGSLFKDGEYVESMNIIRDVNNLKLKQASTTSVMNPIVINPMVNTIINSFMVIYRRASTTPVSAPTTPVSAPIAPTTPVRAPIPPTTLVSAPIAPTTPVRAPIPPTTLVSAPIAPTTPVRAPTTPVRAPTTPVRAPTTPVKAPKVLFGETTDTINLKDLCVPYLKAICRYLQIRGYSTKRKLEIIILIREALEKQLALGNITLQQSITNLNMFVHY